MGLVKKDDGWRIPDELWEQLEPLLPARPSHPLGCHNPRVADRSTMNAILLVLREWVLGRPRLYDLNGIGKVLFGFESFGPTA